MSTMEQQREQQLVRGKVNSIITKGPDTWQVEVLPDGSQYTKNLWTKNEPFVTDMSQRIGQPFDFLCNVSYWKRNDGQQVRSLWFESIGNYGTLADPAPAAAAPPQQYQQPQQAAPQAAYQPPPGPQAGGYQQGQPPASTGYTPPQAQPQPQQQPMAPQQLPQEVKELRIMRQTASKVVGILLPYLPPEERSLDGFMEVAEWLVRYYTGGPQGGPREQLQQPMPQPQGYDPPSGYDGTGTDPGRESGDPGPDYYTGGFPQ